MSPFSTVCPPFYKISRAAAAFPRCLHRLVPLVKVGQRAQVVFISPVPKILFFLFHFPRVFASKDKEEDEMCHLRVPYTLQMK